MAKVITKCPCCHSDIYENAKFYYCKNWNSKDNKCDFTISKQIAQKEITHDNVVDICTTGRTLLIKDFISKTGKPFSAFLVIVNDNKKECKKSISFEFPKTT